MRRSVPLVRIATADETGALQSPLPFCTTPGVMDDLCASVGGRPPESGAFLYGPADKFGCDWIEYDEQGSARASSGVYAPDEVWASERVAFHLENDPLRVLTAVGHSHPLGLGRLSPKVGAALGDLGFAEALFEENPPAQVYGLPVLTGVGTDAITIWPWMVERSDGGVRVSLAELRVCEVAAFPPRVFNPAWEASLAPAESAPMAALPQVDLLALAASVRLSLHLSVRRGVATVRVVSGGVGVKIALSPAFPAEPPIVRLRVGRRRAEFSFRWKSASTATPEQRLARLVRRALRFGREAF